MKSSENSIPMLADLLRDLLPEAAQPDKRPPVHLWNPQHIVDIDLAIRSDGTWWHDGTLIARERLVKLFASILRREPDGKYVLVTPHEKAPVRVEDAPFLAVRLEQAIGRGGKDELVFVTSLGEVVVAGPNHPIRVPTHPLTCEPSPYVMVRDGLEARLSRPVFYQLAEIAVPSCDDGGKTLGVWCSGTFFTIGPSGA